MSQQTDVAPFDPVDESRMSLMEHLIELRTRLIWISGSIIVGTMIGLIFYDPVLRFITATARTYNLELQNIRPTDSINIIFKVGFTVGTSIAMPMIVFQLLSFMAPGLYPHEKRYIYIALPAIVVLFLLGIVFAYTLLLPVAVGFLGNLLTGIVRQDWTAQDYISFVTRLVFWIGVTFEMPLIFAVLARMSVVNSQMLIKYWRHAVVVMSIIAAIITPTVDPVNMSIVMGPLMVLYGLSILLAWLLYVPRVPRDFSQESFIPDKYKDKE